jgi:hypothetical protein
MFLGIMIFSWKIHREEKQEMGIINNLAVISHTAILKNPGLYNFSKKLWIVLYY